MKSRAGVAGRGFAVVAEEVRNLASKSAQAAQNTTNLIEDTLRAVGQGTKIADETEKSMVGAVVLVQNVMADISEISEASTQQEIAIREVTQGVEQISNVVQTNAATSEESAAASMDLSRQAQILKNLVKQYKLKQANGKRTETSGFVVSYEKVDTMFDKK